MPGAGAVDPAIAPRLVERCAEPAELVLRCLMRSTCVVAWLAWLVASCGSATPSPRPAQPPPTVSPPITTAADETRTVAETPPSADAQDVTPPPADPRARSALQDVIRRQAVPAVRACYEAQLDVDPALVGTLMTSFIVLADGTIAESPRVTAALEPASSAAGGALIDCVRGVIASLRFAPSEGAEVVGINYPFVLEGYDCEPSCGDALTASLGPALSARGREGDACLRRVVASSPELTGAVSVVVALDVDGRATSAVVESDSLVPDGEAAARARACVRDAFAELDLGAPIEVATVVTMTLVVPRVP